MKKVPLTSAVITCLVSSSYATTIFIDFGGTNSENWNTRTSASSTATEELTDFDTGLGTGISYGLTDAFVGVNSAGPAPGFGEFNAASTDDSFYVDNSNPKGEIVFTGLDNSTAYYFTFLAARYNVTDNRSTTYTLTGNSTDSVNVNASIANGDPISASNIGNLNEIYPDAGGTITLTVAKTAGVNTNGNGWAYLNAIKLSTVPEPSAYASILGLLALGLVSVRRKKTTA